MYRLPGVGTYSRECIKNTLYFAYIDCSAAYYDVLVAMLVGAETDQVSK